MSENDEYDGDEENLEDDYDDNEEYDDKKYTESKEISIANVLLYGSPSAKQEVLIKLIYIGNVNALAKVLNSLSDPEYRRVMPTA